MTPRAIKKQATQAAIGDVLELIYGLPRAGFRDLARSFVSGPPVEAALKSHAVPTAEHAEWRLEYSREWVRRVASRLTPRVRARRLDRALALVETLVLVDPTHADAVRALQRIASEII